MLGAARLTTKNLTASYSLGLAPSVVNEGEAGGYVYVTGTFYFNDVNIGNTVYWQALGDAGISPLDFLFSEGTFTLTSSPQTFQIGIKGDSLTEGSETFFVRARSNNINGAILATSNTVTINDTSTNATFVFTNPTPLNNPNEGTSTLFRISTTNVANGTVLVYNIRQRGQQANYITAADFTSGSLTGTVTINNNVGEFILTYSNDNTFEGSEAYYVELGNSGIVSNDVYIQDTSDGGASLKIYPDAYDRGDYLKLALPFRQSTQFNDIAYNFYSSTQNVAATRTGPSGVVIATSGQKFYDGVFTGDGTQTSPNYNLTTNVNTRADFCIMFWAKTSSANWNNWVFGNNESGAGFRQYETGVSLSTYNLDRSPNNDVIRLAGYGFDTTLNTFTANDGASGRIGGLAPNQWYHFCFTKTSWWINGTFKGNATWGSSTWNSISVGAQIYGGAGFNGSIQDFRVYVGRNVIADYASFTPPAQMMPT